VRLATWNVNSLRARSELVGSWLSAYQPDVLCLQETKVKDEEFPVAVFHQLGYQVAHWGSSSWNGVALVTREPVANLSRGFGADGEEARLIAGDVGGIRVFSVYVPNGRALDDPHYDYKLLWLEALRAALAQAMTCGPVVVAGDFNIAPGDDDVWDPKALIGSTHVSEPERSALVRLMELGLFDCGATVPGEGPRYTWWDYRQGAFRRDMGMRIDLVLASESLRTRVRGYQVDRLTRAAPKPSDHAPVVVDL
jgi:exodeoxyribonuclease-3